MPIRYGLKTPPGVTSSDPGPDGVYPLTNLTTPPKMLQFFDRGYGVAAFYSPNEKGACDILLTINANGTVSNPEVTRCERPVLEQLAIKSLLDTPFKPGRVNGKAVPIRVSIHIEYKDVTPKS
jgi:hypothetical protein